MADVTGRIGDQDVALDNAATEATLKDLLAALRGQQSALSRLTGTASQAGISPQAIAAANEGLRETGVAAQAGVVVGKALNLAMGGLSKGAMLLGAVLGDIVSGGIQTGKNLIDLAGQMLDGRSAASDLFGALRDLPLGLGLVAGLFQKLAKFQEANLEGYRELTKAGVNFSGSLDDVRITALEMGTTLEGFTKLVKENSTLFAQLGATADAGARSFVNLAKDIRNGDVGKNLRALGFSIDDINNSTANYLKMTGGRTAEEMKNTKALGAAAGAYMTQLDMLATITGKNRQAEEEKLRNAAANIAFEAKMQSLSEDERSKANAALANAMSIGGQGAVDALQARIMGIPPMTEAGQMFEAMSRNASIALHKQATAITDSTKSLVDIEKGYGEMLAGSAQDAKNIGKEQMAAFSVVGGVQAEVALTAQKNANLMHSKNLKNADDVNRLQQEIAAANAARDKSTAAAAAEAQEAFKKLTTEIMAALLPVFAKLGPAVLEVAKTLMDFAIKNMPAIKTALEAVVKFVEDMFSPEGREKIAKQLAEGLGNLLKMAWDSFSIFGNSNAEIGQNNQSATDNYNVSNEFSGEPGSANGNVLAGPKSGYAALLHGTEAVVPLPDGRNIPVNLDMKMPDFSAEIGKEFSAFKAEMQQYASEKTNTSSSDMLSSIKESLFGREEQAVGAAVQDPVSKDLLSEMQQLNKQTAQMLAFMRDSTDFSRRNLDAIRGLNGNLLI